MLLLLDELTPETFDLQRWWQKACLQVTNLLCANPLGSDLYNFIFRVVTWRSHLEIFQVTQIQGFPGGASGKEPACQCRRHKRHWFGPRVGKIPLEEGIAIHSSILAWRSPRTEKPGGLPSIGSHRVRTRLKWLSTQAWRAESATFLRSSSSFSWRIRSRNQNLVVRCAHCYWNVVSRPS